MTEITLIAVIAILIVQNVADKIIFLRHLRSLEKKVMTGNPDAEVETYTPNEIMTDPLRDIADVNIESLVKNIKQKVTR